MGTQPNCHVTKRFSMKETMEAGVVNFTMVTLEWHGHITLGGGYTPKVAQSHYTQ